MRPDHGLARGSADPSIGSPASWVISRTVTGASSATLTIRPSIVPGEREADGGHDVAVVGYGVGVCGVQPEAPGERGHRCEVPVAVAVDEREAQDRPGQAAAAQELLGGDLLAG